MVEYRCQKCGSELLLGMGNYEVNWCPKCEGIQTGSAQEGKNILRSELKKMTLDLRNSIKNFDKEQLATNVYIERETRLRFEYNDFMEFMAFSYLLNEVCNSEGGSKQVEQTNKEIQKMYQLAHYINRYQKDIQLLDHDWLALIYIKRRDIRKYNFDFDRSVITEGIKFVEDEGEEIEPIFKFKAKWREVRDNLRQYGFLTLNEAYFDFDFGTKLLLLDEFWISVRTKIGMELGAGNIKLLELPHFAEDIKYLKIWEDFTNNLKFQYTKEADASGKVVSFTLKPVDPVTVFTSFFKNDLELNYVKKFMTSCEDKIDKGFPVILSTTKGLYIGPRTIIVISRYLKARDFRGYLDTTKNIGSEFEKVVADELEKSGISVTSPDDSHSRLLNIKDDPVHPSLEIDLIAHNKATIYVIECKHVVISTDFIIGHRENNIKRNLRDEPEKMKRRVVFIIENMEKYGFNREIFKEVKPVFVTFNEEPLKNFEGIAIISLQRLKGLKGKEIGEYFMMNARGVKIYSEPDKYEMLKIPKVNSITDEGSKYYVLSVGKISKGNEEFPVATIKVDGENKLFRLPDDYLDWVNFSIQVSAQGSNMFPATVIFWYSLLDNEYHAQIL